ncbi:MAG TPA: flagellar export chaperone FliS [Gemmatimonadaceae bacterium]|jgi:flagellar protein FliS
MSYSNQAAAYRHREVAAATPGRLLLMVYDHILANLARATVAHNNKLIEARVEAVAKARDGISELVATLDMEKGGAISAQLNALYTFMLGQLVTSGLKFEEPKVARMAAMIRELRDAFAVIVESQAKTSAA